MLWKYDIVYLCLVKLEMVTYNLSVAEKENLYAMEWPLNLFLEYLFGYIFVVKQWNWILFFFLLLL
jgi:hypothetical protein